METTETGSESRTLDLDSAVDLMIQPEAPEEETEIEESEAEVTQDEPEADEDESVEDDDGEDDGESDEESDDDGEDDDYESDEDEPDQAGTDQTFRVKVDGEEVSVTLEDLKRGYSGQQYVQKGMQQAAEARKQAEEVFNAFQQERQNLAQLVQQVQQGGVTPPQEPSRELFNSDPIGYMEAKMDYDEKMQGYQAQQAQVQKVMQEQSQAEQQASQARAQQEAQKLVEIVPELRDAKAASKFKEKLVETATSVYGYTQDEIANIGSHRDFLVLRDAMKYREIMAGKTKAETKAQKAKPMLKAGAKKKSTQGDAARKIRQKLKQSGSIEDAMALMIR